MTVDITPQAATTKRDKGFTLVELLIVIAILGVLATITVLSVRGISNNSKASTCKADGKVLAVGIEAHNAQYPALVAVPYQETVGGAAVARVNGATVTLPAGYPLTIAQLGTTPEKTLLALKLIRAESPNADIAIAAGGTGGEAYVAGDVFAQSGSSCLTSTMKA